MYRHFRNPFIIQATYKSVINDFIKVLEVTCLKPEPSDSEHTGERVFFVETGTE